MEENCSKMWYKHISNFLFLFSGAYNRIILAIKSQFSSQ